MWSNVSEKNSFLYYKHREEYLKTTEKMLSQIHCHWKRLTTHISTKQLMCFKCECVQCTHELNAPITDDEQLHEILQIVDKLATFWIKQNCKYFFRNRERLSFFYLRVFILLRQIFFYLHLLVSYAILKGDTFPNDSRVPFPTIHSI